MSRRLLLSFLVVTLALVQAQQKKGGKKKQADPEASSPAGPIATWAGVIPAQPISDAGRQSDWPAISYSKDGSLWAIYVEWNDKDADRVLVRRRDPQGRWGTPIELPDGNWDHYSPTIAGRDSSAVAIWSSQINGNFELFWSEINAQGAASRPQRLTNAPYSDFNARAVASPSGEVTVAWQSFRNGQSDIYARRLTGSNWGIEERVSTFEGNDWEPDVALDSQGLAWISWDTYENGNYDVMLRSFNGRLAGKLIPIATESAAQFHTTVAIDKSDRIWVAWDEAGENWGKDFSRSSSTRGSSGLHSSRELGIRVVAAGVVNDLPAAVNRRFTGRMRRYAELPRLAADANGSIHLMFRHWTSTQPHEIYHSYGIRLSGEEWSEPYQLDRSSGPNTVWTALARKPGGGLTVAYPSDGRSPQNLPKDQMHALHTVVSIADWEAGASPASTALTPAVLPAPGKPSPRRVRATMKAGGKTYTLLLGDCHRHTDIRGHSGVDGSILDTYRYALDAAQLDFLGTADHNEVNGGRWPDGLRDYQWWWTQKAVDLHTHMPRFIGVYSYEHSMARPAGHRNVLFLKRGAPLRPIDRSKEADNQPPALWQWWEQNVLSQPGQKSVIVPHTFAAGPLADWNWPNARFDCLLEMYQGARGSYEAYKLPDNEKRGPTQVDEDGHYARNALAKGNTYGFVSFSDHGSTHNSWAGVWVTREDREGLLDGMYARHTFAASDEIIVRASANGNMPGDEWSSRTPARIEATVEAPDEILRIDIVKDGKYVYTTRPNARTARINWRDTDRQSGRSYYYLRVFQRDPDNPDGDPEIAWSSPFYVTYP